MEPAGQTLVLAKLVAYVAAHAYRTSARMSAQASVLTVHPDPRKPHNSKTLRCFQIPGKLAPALKMQLRRLGMHPATVFPDLDGLAKSIRYNEF